MLVRTTLAWALLLSTAWSGQNVVVVLDDSGSMADPMRSDRSIRRIDAAKQALRVVLVGLPDDAHVGVLALNAGSAGDHWIIPFGEVDRSQLEQATSRIRAQGGTPLGEFMKIGTDALLQQRAEQRYGEYRLLIVTDGEATDQDLLDSMLPDIMSRGIDVDVIGVDMRSQHSLATLVHTYRRADDPSSLEQAIAASLAETDTTTDVAGESDFELLADFPAELAPAVLTALTQPNNQPIGQLSRDDVVAEFDPGYADPGFRPVGVPVNNGRVGGVVGLTVGMVCVVTMCVMVLALVLVVKAAVRR